MNKFVPLVLFVILVGFLYIGLDLDPKKLPSPLIGKEFPNLEVEDFDNGTRYYTSDKTQDKISLVNVWASWCVTCRAEHEMLNEIAKTNKVQMIGVNYKDTKNAANRYLDILHNPYDIIIFDPLGSLGLELGVYATPETFIVDQKGLIRYKRIGQMTKKIWNEEVVPIINELNKT
ncbi:MAG: DsbE family thiol:disulfide interchange protein [Gammaproteobacteria bacterium]|jgi:cytochrome c biogenesis protein CcmG/thiol:disulfide interchange protein DsbE|nr:DsbE family thiol:disulfide interchange protein [Gammaproteobacteria bacterium]